MKCYKWYSIINADTHDDTNVPCKSYTLLLSSTRVEHKSQLIKYLDPHNINISNVASRWWAGGLMLYTLDLLLCGNQAINCTNFYHIFFFALPCSIRFVFWLVYNNLESSVSISTTPPSRNIRLRVNDV